MIGGDFFDYKDKLYTLAQSVFPYQVKMLEFMSEIFALDAFVKENSIDKITIEDLRSEKFDQLTNYMMINLQSQNPDVIIPLAKENQFLTFKQIENMYYIFQQQDNIMLEATCNYSFLTLDNISIETKEKYKMSAYKNLLTNFYPSFLLKCTIGVLKWDQLLYKFFKECSNSSLTHAKKDNFNFKILYSLVKKKGTFFSDLLVLKKMANEIDSISLFKNREVVKITSLIDQYDALSIYAKMEG